jgi:hypothetical protein
MRKYSKATSDEVVETFGSDVRTGLALQTINTLRKVHGLNKLEEEVKV